MKRMISIGLVGAAALAIGSFGASAAPLTPPSVPAEVETRAEVVKHRRYHRRHAHRGHRYHRRYSHRHHRHWRHHRHRHRYGGYYGGPFLYGGVGVPLFGLSIGVGPWHHRHRHHHWHW